MNQHIFVDRAVEQQFLTDRYRSPIPEFLILYGRRRVGKTTLLARFLQTVPGFYFLASEEGTARNVQDFSHYAGEYLNDPDFERSRYANQRRELPPACAGGFLRVSGDHRDPRTCLSQITGELSVARPQGIL